MVTISTIVAQIYIWPNKQNKGERGEDEYEKRRERTLGGTSYVDDPVCVVVVSVVGRESHML